MNFPHNTKVFVRPRCQKIRHLVKGIMLICSIRFLAPRDYETNPIKEMGNVAW